MKQEDIRDTIEMLKRLEDDNPADDTRIAIRKAELDDWFNQQIIGYKSPYIRQAWDMYYNTDITFEHMLLEIIKAQSESLKDLQDAFENYIMTNPNPVIYE